MSESAPRPSMKEESQRFLQAMLIILLTGGATYVMSLLLPGVGQGERFSLSNRFLLIAVANLVFFYTFRGMPWQGSGRLYAATAILAAFMTAVQYVLYHLFF